MRALVTTIPVLAPANYEGRATGIVHHLGLQIDTTMTLGEFRRRSATLSKR